MNGFRAKNYEEKLCGDYYFFDCLDGNIGDKLLTLKELKEIMTNEDVEFTEKKAIQIARDYEATLYKYTFNEDGEQINRVMLYESWACFG